MRIASLLAALLMAGCTPSFNPLSTGQDKTFDPALLGRWRSADDRSGDRFEVLRGRDGAYRVVLNEREHGTGTFAARLVQLGPHRFVDLWPEAPLGDGFFKNHFLRTHTFGRILLEGDRLRIGMLDPDWFKTEDGRKAGLPLVSDKDGALLTATTAQLRDFAARYAESKAFDATEDWAAWVREK